MNNGKLLQELIQCERQSELEPERINHGWNRVSNAVAAGYAQQIHHGADKTLRLARAWPIRLRTAALAAGGLTMVTLSGLWYSTQRTAFSPRNHALANATLTVISNGASQVPSPLGTGTASSPSVADHAATAATSTFSSAVDANQTESGSARVRKNGGPSGESTVSGTSDGFDQELSLIKAAKNAFDTGADAQGLSLLAEHSQRFPRGVFAGEREALRVLANCRKQPAPDGRKLAEAFIRSYPNSPMIDRIAKACSVQINQKRK